MKNTDIKIQEYLLTNDAYTGEGVFAHGGGIFQNGAEAQDYKNLQDQAFYTPQFKSIVDSIVNPVFNTPAKREYDSELVEALLEDVDNAGTNMQQFIYGVTLATRLLANAFVICDNFSDTPETIGEVISERRFPYFYMKKPQDVYEYTQDIFGNLTFISFYYSIDNEGNVIYKGWDDSVSVMYRVDADSGERVVIREVKHNLNKLPVIVWTNDILKFPTYYSMATIARAIYNVDAQMRDLSTVQGLSLLIIPGQQPKDGVRIGRHHALFINEQASQTPNYISPNQAILDSLREYRESLVNSLLQAGDILGSTAMSNASSSGVALSYRFMGTADSLRTTSMIAEHFESKMVELFGVYMGQYFEYEVHYEDNYAPSFVETQAKLVTLENVLALNINDSVNGAIHKSIVDLLATFTEMDDDTVAMLKQSIDSDLGQIEVEDDTELQETTEDME